MNNSLFPRERERESMRRPSLTKHRLSAFKALADQVRPKLSERARSGRLFQIERELKRSLRDAVAYIDELQKWSQKA